jgi:hypothetical protein
MRGLYVSYHTFRAFQKYVFVTKLGKNPYAETTTFRLYLVISDWSFVWIQKHRDQATATTTTTTTTTTTIIIIIIL